MNRTEMTRGIRHLRRGHRERGVAAIAMALLSVGIAGGAMVSFLLLRSQDAQVHSEQQSQMLAWAEHAVRDFAMTRGRLPCPAITQDGPEACSGASEGWLPLTSLAAVTGGPPGNRNRTGVRYTVANGGGASGSADLSAGDTPSFLPRTESGAAPGKPGEADEYPTNIASSMDLCEKLQPASASGAAAASAPPEANPIQPPTTGGGGTAFRVSMAPHGVASPPSGNSGNPADTQRDTSRTTSPEDLHTALGCGPARASLDTMAVVQSWSKVNEGNRTGVITFADRIVVITGLSLTANIIGEVMQVADIFNGLFNAVSNAEKLAEAIALPPLAPFIPVHIEGEVTAISGMVMSAVDLARSTLAIAVDAVYLAGYQAASDTLNAFVVWTGGAQMLQSAHALGISYDMPPPPAPAVAAPQGSGS